MTVDTSVLVATIASAGVIATGVIQGALTHSAAKRADAARDDERRQEALRRREERANEQQIRAEEHEAELERVKAAAEAAADADRRSSVNEARARMRQVAAQFAGQAERCLLILRRADGLFGSIEHALPETDWGILGTMLGDVTAAFDLDDSLNAREAVNSLRDASIGQDRAQHLQQAQLNLEMFSDAARLASG